MYTHTYASHLLFACRKGSSIYQGSNLDNSRKASSVCTIKEGVIFLSKHEAISEGAFCEGNVVVAQLKSTMITNNMSNKNQQFCPPSSKDPFSSRKIFHHLFINNIIKKVRFFFLLFSVF